MPKFSLIIPVFNVEKYIHQCLDSCVNQTFKDIEIICIDDCSSDNSFKILQEYAKKDSRIIVKKNEQNSGLSVTRNFGLSIASGEYIWFIDSDDYVNINACDYFYTNCRNNDLDVLRFNAEVFYRKTEDTEKIFVDSDYYTKWPINKILSMETLQDSLPLDFCVSSCLFVAKSDLIKQFSFTVGRLYEDTDFTPILFSNSNRLKCVNFCGYYRRITPGSITQSPINKKKLLDRLDVTNRLFTYIRSNDLGKSSYLYHFMRSYSFMVNNTILNPNIQILSKEEPEYTNFIKIISQFKEKNNLLMRIYSKGIRLVRKILGQNL